MDYTALIIPLIIIIIFFTAMTFIYKDKEKVDKGFKVNFFRLSYRRRMIRSLSGVPFAILVFFLLYYFEFFSFDVFLVILAIILMVYALEAGYNYRMWKKEEAEKVSE
ncbi:hypothetical protein [Planococcus beigongshangi]|uniref:hypothetical protein n=1 Tax=Planococcus beigongshangi TaxID=2782536 RepID=UPI00193C8160|nr:hypothetical protein [Planococcus beigongshangi]